MNAAIQDMLAPYQPQTPQDYQNAVREIVQEIALLGFSRHCHKRNLTRMNFLHQFFKLG